MGRVSSKILKKFDIPYYDGKNAASARTFIFRIKKFADLSELNDTEKCYTLMAHLKGTAATWYEQLPEEEQDSWEDLVTAFKKEFATPRPGASQATVLSKVSQGPSSTADYYDSFVKICNDNDFDQDDEVFKDFFIVGLRPELQQFARSVEKKTVKKIAKFVAKIEPALPRPIAAAKRPAPTAASPALSASVASSGVNMRSADDRPICRKCNRVGHIAKYCRATTVLPLPATASAPPAAASSAPPAAAAPAARAYRDQPPSRSAVGRVNAIDAAAPAAPAEQRPN